MTLGSRTLLLLRASAVVAAVLAAKALAHAMGWEVLTVNPLFSGIVAANIFLMGFLISGVLADYKESERLPGELATSLENLAQEVRGIHCAKPEAQVDECLGRVADLGGQLLAWFHKRITTDAMLGHLNALTPQLARLEQWAQATLVARLKAEQGALRRIVVRSADRYAWLRLDITH